MQEALTAGPDEYLRVSQTEPGRSRTLFSYLLGGFPSMTRFLTFADCAENMKCALLERVFFHEIGGVFTSPHDPGVGAVESLLTNFKRKFLRVCPKATPVERHEYVAATYRGHRRTIYENACQKLDRRGLLKTDSYLSTFLKYEKIKVESKRQVPRVIQPRKPAYNVELGRYLHPIEHTVYRAIDRVFGHPTVMKGLNASQQGTIFHEAWATFKHPQALCIDASRFDQHIRVGLLSWEHSLYKSIFSSDPELQQLLRWQLESRGFARAGGKLFSYKVKGGRCSGDMNTAMGNILVACGGVYEFLRCYGCQSRVRVLDAGDDCVLMGEREDIGMLVPVLQPWFLQLGLIMKVEPLVDVLEQISFCQTNPVYDGRSWRMVRDPRVTLTKDVTILYQRHLADLTNYAISVGKCGLSLTGGLPVLQDYYVALGALKPPLTTGVDPLLAATGFFRLAEGMRESYRMVTDEARVSFWRAFGIVPDLQIALEEHYRAQVVTHHPTVADDEVDRVDTGPGVGLGN